MINGPERGSVSSLAQITHVFNWPPINLRHVQSKGGLWSAHRRNVFKRDQTSRAFFGRPAPAYTSGEGGFTVPQTAHNLCASWQECGGNHFLINDGLRSQNGRDLSLKRCTLQVFLEYLSVLTRLDGGVGLHSSRAVYNTYWLIQTSPLLADILGHLK